MLKVLIITLALWQLLAAAELTDDNVDLVLPNSNETELEEVGARTYRFRPFQLRNKAYAVNSYSRADWFTAQKICSFQGMNLASMNTPEEAERVRRFLFDNGYTVNQQTYWVSGTDLGSRGQWYWMSNGLPITYFNWLPGEPNNAGGNERCLQISYDGGWNDLHCEAAQFFICENRCQLDSYSVPLYPNN